MDPREQIKAKIDIVSFISEHIPLKQMGRNFKTLCPFHGEKTPSFVVSPERQIWHCFGCGKGGDIFTFLMEYEKMDFVEALRTLAKRTGVKLTSLAPTQAEAQKEKLFAINHLAQEFYHYLLTTHKAGERALEYLKKRGINKKTIETFALGFAPDKWDLLFAFLTKKKGFLPQDIEETGLIIKSQKPPLRQGFAGQAARSNYYDRFRNRIIFTLRDHRGNVVGFAGRVLDPDVKEAKYVNTPETPLYHKGELFYGLDIAKDAIKKENQAIVVEGEFDMIQSFQAGVANVVALKGTALTLSQAKLIRRFSQNIALAFDEDIAGDAAARRGISIADNEGLNIKVIRVKEGKDPDELIKKNPLAWKKAIKGGESVYDFLIDSALARFDNKTPDGKKAIADEVLPTISAISNEIVKAHFIKRLGKELDVSEDVVIRQMEKVSQNVASVVSQSAPLKPVSFDRRHILEEYFLALLLQKGDKEVIKKIYSELEEDALQSSLLKKLFDRLAIFYESQNTFAITAFVKDLPKELLPTVDRLYLFDTESVKQEHMVLELEQVIHELHVLSVRGKMEEIAKALKEKEIPQRELSLKKEFRFLSEKLRVLGKSS